MRKPLFEDTSPEAEAVLFEALRNMPASRKFELLAAHNEGVLEIARSGIRQQFPRVSERQLRYLLAQRLWGDEIAKWIQNASES